MTNYRIFARDVDKLTREEWLGLRAKGIGGSDAAAICGLSEFAGPLSAYLTKIAQAPNREPNDAMRIGTMMEDTIIAIFTEQTGMKVRRDKNILQHAEIDWMLANLDGWVQDPEEETEGVFEAKNVSEHKNDQWADGNVPDQYQTQVQHCLGVTGATYAWIAPLIGGNRLKPVKLLRNERFIKSLIKIEEDFWGKVQDRTPPPVDGTEDSSRILKYLYAQSTETTVEIEKSLYTNLLSARQRRIDAELDERLYENQIKEQMKEAALGVVQGSPKPVVTWRGSAVKRLDVGRIQDAEPEVCAKYMSESTTRRFVVKKVEE